MEIVLNKKNGIILHTEKKYCAEDITITVGFKRFSGEFVELDSNLPVEYIKLDYIESTGTQYIDTGVKLTNNHSVEIDYQLTDNNQKRAGLFGNLISNATARYGSILSPTNSALEHGYGAGNVYWQQGTPDTNRHLLKQDKNKIYIDSILVYTFEQATFSISDSAPLGNFGYVNYTPAKAKYYGSRWWDGDTLVRDFIPCKRGSDAVIGMYDTITQQFFENKGTGEFLGG